MLGLDFSAVVGSQLSIYCIKQPELKVRLALILEDLCNSPASSNWVEVLNALIGELPTNAPFYTR